jgi:origin recognition complex subunit 3
VEAYLASGEDLDLVKSWLDSDRVLFDYVMGKLDNVQEILSNLVKAIEILGICLKCVPRISQIPRSSLYIEALENSLQDSASFRELLLAIKRAPSDQLLDIIAAIAPFLPSTEHRTVTDIERGLRNLLDATKSEAPLRSEHDVRNDTLRTTVVAQKVQLSRHKSSISESATAYSKLLDSFHGWFEGFFQARLVKVHHLFLREIVLYDLRATHRAVFAAKTRFSIERALSSPHDYLNCSCCASESEGDGQATLQSTQPTTAILYQLYLESGPLINVSDLWSAFSAVVGDEREEGNEAIALFERALAELKYLGLIKSTRKKADHIAKVAWQGL